MGKIQKEISAISIFTAISNLLEDSQHTILSIFSDNWVITKTNYQPKTITPGEMEQFKKNVETLSKFMSITPLETLVFTAIYSVETIRQCTVDSRDISKFFDINGLSAVALRPTILSLQTKGVIRQVERRRGAEQFRITSEAEYALIENKPFKKQIQKKIDQFEFCHIISNFIDERRDEDIETRILFHLVKDEEVKYKNLDFVKQVKKLLLNIEDRALFYEICDDFVSCRRRSNTEIGSTLDDMYDNIQQRLKKFKELMNKTNSIIENELVDLVPGRFNNEAELCLTEKGRRLFLKEDYDLFSKQSLTDTRLITPDKLPARELFFNEELTKDIDFLKSSLMNEEFLKLQERLEKRGLTKGVAALLHGLPGTGKTAVAEKLAKDTGRSIYHVDIAASKTCWFGESEKLFKRIFTDYKRMCESEPLKPILLFNEADALFSKRKSVDSNNCAQTENALQNILLEEMENLDGILIATTNLCDNFDSAFERRFLFKIKFGQPTTDAKKAIWKSKLDWLEEEICHKLAAQYDLSGGEIDNIVRKCIMEETLTGNRPTIEKLFQWCKNEKLGNSSSAKLGFAC